MATKLSDEGTQSSNPSSSSYANIVLSLKGERVTENNKENIHDMNQSLKSAETSKETVDVAVTAAPTTITTTTINPQVPKTVKNISDKNKNENQDETELSEVEDDSSFTPVVSHSRREKKDKRKDKVRGNKGAGREARRSRERKEKREKKQSSDVQLENSTVTKGSSDENQEETEDGPKVFVEAPIPKVNAWKVSLFNLI